MRKFFAAFVAGLLLAGGPASAEFSEEWEAYAAETRAACETFEAGLPSAAGALPALTNAGDDYVWPRGTPGRPHTCLYFSVEIDDSGAPADVSLLFKGPDNLNYKFVRAGMRLVKSRRYEAPGEGEAYAPVVTRIVIQSEPNWRFRYWVNDIR
ncbi:MAG: hypothetical protein KDE05_01590 [Parvularculaceae bacterium]|nr:hypothetical protein [Parvularculaceae bacterium]